MTRPGAAAIFALALAAVTALPADALAQSRQAVTGFTVSGRLGYDVEFDVLAVGAGLRAGLGRLPFEAQVAGDFTFLSGGVTERQVAVDLLYRVGSGGLALGGGPVFRNTYWEVTDESLGSRETRTGYSLVLALGGVPDQRSRLVTGLEIRWISVGDFNPRTIMAQVGLSLARRW